MGLMTFKSNIEVLTLWFLRSMKTREKDLGYVLESLPKESIASVRVY